MSTILIVEDEPKLASMVAAYFTASGFETHWLSNGLEVVPWVRLHAPDLILLDVGLPGRNGVDVCRDLRGFSDVPVVMVTAEAGEIARVASVELGAEYVQKPFSPRELRARVERMLNR